MAGGSSHALLYETPDLRQRLAPPGFDVPGEMPDVHHVGVDVELYIYSVRPY